MVFKTLAAALLKMSRSVAERSAAQRLQPVIQPGSTMKLPVALLSLLLATTGGPVLAACEKSQRLDHQDAPCMNARYERKGYRHWNPEYYAWVKNTCKDKGKIVAKLDIQTKADLTWHLESDDTREYRGKGYLRGIYYCKDISDPKTRP